MFTPVASYFRVYEPLRAFDDADFWREYAESGEDVPTWEGPAVIRELLYSRIGWPWRELPDFPREAYLHHDPETLVCPWNLKYRMAHVAVELAAMLPGALGERLFPSEFTSTATDAIAADIGLDRHQPPSDVHERIAIWTVPLRWLVAVKPSERVVSVGPDARYLLYRTSISAARERIRTVLAAAEDNDWDEEEMTMALRHTLEWLSGFHRDSMVELDFGGVTTLWSDEEVLTDDSVEQAWSARRRIAAGEMEAAFKGLERLQFRLKEIRWRERLN
ncbi:hypothetical protein [Salininema proteolyticum]|uniref:DUF8083 domain-containing protein n=1 Tax=Salininema proteolyticum TaxID=1607685 RepID=A0ABV8TTF2_9ACTN